MEAPPRSQRDVREDAVDDDARMMLSRYLALIKEFLQRKQLALTASSAGSTRRSTRSSTNGGLFQVIERVCDDRIRQLERQAAAPFSHSRSGGRARMVEPRVVVAEALVQELLTSLTYLSLEEREQLVLDEVERVEDLRRLHMDLVREEQYLSSQVNAATGEARRLHELQAMLREEFLQEYQDQHSAMTTTTAARMEETLEQKEASLQFAWETIREQKNEIVRLRAMVQHYEERQPTQQCNSTPGLADSCMDPTLISRGSTSLQPQEPAKAINKLRSQLSSYHRNNLNILQDHIERLEDALSSAALDQRQSNNCTNIYAVSQATIDSSQASHGKPDPLCSCTGVADLSESPLRSRKNECAQCCRTRSLVLKLQSELQQMKTQATLDEESLIQAESSCQHLQRENAALTTSLIGSKQQHDHLRQMILEVTAEKHAMQTEAEAQHRKAERSIRILREQLQGLDAWKRENQTTVINLEKTIEEQSLKQQQLEVKSAHLKGQLEKMQDLQDMLDREKQNSTRLQNEMESFKEHIGLKEGDIERLTKEMQALVNISAQQEQQLDEQKKQLSEADKEVHSLHTMLSTSQANQQNVQQEVEVLQQEIEQLRDINRKSSTSQHETDQILAKLKHEHETVLSLLRVDRERHLLLQQEFEQCQLLLSEARSQAVSNAKELETVTAKLNAMEAHAKFVERERANLTEKYVACQSMVEKLRQDGPRLQSEIEERDIMLTRAHDHAREQVQQAKTKFEADLESSRKEVDTAKQANIQLTQELSELKTTVLTWMTKYNAVMSDKSTLNQAMKKLQEENGKLQKRVIELDAEAQDLSAVNEEHLALVSNLRENHELKLITLSNAYEQKENQLEMQLKESMEQAAECQRDILCLRAELYQQNSANEKHAELSRTLEAEAVEKEQQLESLRVKTDELAYKLHEEQQHNKNLVSLIDVLQKKADQQSRKHTTVGSMIQCGINDVEACWVAIVDSLEQTETRLWRLEYCCKVMLQRLIHTKNKPLLESQVTTPSMAAVSAGSSTHHDDALIHKLAKHVEELCSIIRQSSVKSPVPESSGVRKMDEGLDVAAFLQKLSTIITDRSKTDSVSRHARNDSSKFNRIRAASVTSGPEKTAMTIPVTMRRGSSKRSHQGQCITISTKRRSTVDRGMNTDGDMIARQLRADLDEANAKIARLRWTYLADAVSSSCRLASAKTACFALAHQLRLEVDLWHTRSLALQYMRWRQLVVRVLNSEHCNRLKLTISALVSSAAQQRRRMTIVWQWKELSLLLTIRQLRWSQAASILQIVVLSKKWTRSRCVAVFMQAKLASAGKKCVLLQQSASAALSQSHAKELKERETSDRLKSMTAGFSDCVRLLQRFCEDQPDSAPPIGTLSADEDAEALTRYLLESCKHVTAWKIAMNKKINDYQSAQRQLHRLKVQATELQQLLLLNQKLFEQLECRAKERQHIVDAAWLLARAFQNLGEQTTIPAATSHEFYYACKRLVSTLGNSKISNSAAVLRPSRVPTHEKSVVAPTSIPIPSVQAKRPLKSLSRSSLQAVPEEEVMDPSPTTVDCNVSNAQQSDGSSAAGRHRLNESNISMLEDIVSSLRNAQTRQRDLQRALVSATLKLHTVRRDLRQKTASFELLRAFMKWKCRTYALRLETHPVHTEASETIK